VDIGWQSWRTTQLTRPFNTLTICKRWRRED